MINVISLVVYCLIFSIHYTLYNYSHKKRKDGLKTRPHCWYFCLSLKYLGLPYGAYIKTAKNSNFCEELLIENDFEALLATFCCYDHVAKPSEAVQKIATDQEEYSKSSLYVIIYWITKIYLLVNNSDK